MVLHTGKKKSEIGKLNRKKNGLRSSQNLQKGRRKRKGNLNKCVSQILLFNPL
jgi:hypothetical protein